MPLSRIESCEPNLGKRGRECVVNASTMSVSIIRVPSTWNKSRRWLTHFTHWIRGEWLSEVTRFSDSFYVNESDHIICILFNAFINTLILAAKFILPVMIQWLLQTPSGKKGKPCHNNYLLSHNIYLSIYLNIYLFENIWILVYF